MGIENSNGSIGITNTVYGADEPIWPMGCARQDQACIHDQTGRQICTALSGEFDFLQNLGEVFTEPGVGEWIYYITSLYRNYLTYIIQDLGSQSLASRFNRDSILQTNIVSDQWQLDVQHWMDTSLAALQLGLLDVALGPARANPELNSTINKVLILPNNTFERQLCQSQVSVTGQDARFSKYGLTRHL